MLKNILSKSGYRRLFALTIIALLSSCEKYVDIEIAPTQIDPQSAYITDASATSAVLALYSAENSRTNIIFLNYYAGISADDLQYNGSDVSTVEIANNTISSNNNLSSTYLWQYVYAMIRTSNLVIEGLTNSTSITPALKTQLLGEAKFWRAYEFFNLVNFFGDVPLSLNTLPMENSSLPRAKTADVYAQIIKDLTEAKAALPETYPTVLRARVNKWAATALLARVYLYNKDYTGAEREASQVITQSALYTMPAPAVAFKNASTEIILQQATQFGNSTIAASYRGAANVIPVYSLYRNFNRNFELNDRRKTDWTDSVVTPTLTTYRINKYKLATANATVNGDEFNVMLRLAEQYLIRAEARTYLNNFSGANADLNVVRQRAGLGDKFAGATPAQSTLLTAILQERKVELFGEFGHRWFDLVRTGQATAVLSPLKTGWKSTAVLFPIPAAQVQQVGLPQNPGYN